MSELPCQRFFKIRFQSEFCMNLRDSYLPITVMPPAVLFHNLIMHYQPIIYAPRGYQCSKCSVELEHKSVVAVPPCLHLYCWRCYKASIPVRCYCCDNPFTYAPPYNLLLIDIEDPPPGALHAQPSEDVFERNAAWFYNLFHWQ
jgi:hypothetical protein